MSLFSVLTFLPRPDQDGLPLAQQGVRGDSEEQAQAGRRPEGLRGRRPSARREAPQEPEVPRELAERRREAAAACLPAAEPGVTVGSRGREVLCGMMAWSELAGGGVPSWLRCIHAPSIYCATAVWTAFVRVRARVRTRGVQADQALASRSRFGCCHRSIQCSKSHGRVFWRTRAFDRKRAKTRDG